MAKITIKNIIQNSIVPAFTIAAALIWVDFIREAIKLFFPISTISSKFLAAVIATIFVIIAIYLILRVESQAERITNNFKRK